MSAAATAPSLAPSFWIDFEEARNAVETIVDVAHDDPEERPRGNTARTGGTWDASGGDSGDVGKAPGAGLSDHNGPSDPDAKDVHSRPR